ncbi:MAG: hypothetical protein WEB87_00060 [Bacteriovoracaceae bacterium]
MKNLKYKIMVPVVLLSLAVAAKFVLWDYPVSTGKRTGNLVKVTEKGKILKTWEGTLDLGSGDLLTFDFSIKDEALAQEMYDYEGKTVSIYYQEHFVGWPRETKYDVIEWNKKNKAAKAAGQSAASLNGKISSISGGENAALNLLNKTLFCSVVGSLYQDQKLYKEVKSHLKKNNLYLYRQIEKCND